MKLTLQLNIYDNLSKNGYPVIVNASHRKTVKRFRFGLFSFPDHWDFDNALPNKLHPEYSFIYPEVIDLKAKIKELQYARVTDFDEILLKLKGPQSVNQNFYDFAAKLAAEKRKNQSQSTALIYDTAIKQLQFVFTRLNFEDINYNTLNTFKNYKIQQGVKNVTIHNYLRTFRAIYNEAVARNITKDTFPFKVIFKGLRVRSHSSKKKYLDQADIKKIEATTLSGNMDLCRDLFLLQFYFGGQDLIDIYNLKYSQINNNRVHFNRGKLGDKGYTFDLLVPAAAAKILSKYKGINKEYCIPGRKDYDGYRTFRRRYGRYLIKLQDETGIVIKPNGGLLGIKVARHTFANIGKRFFLEEDLLRELMGHERDDVDNYYKDRYPEAVRDAAQLQIIDTK